MRSIGEAARASGLSVTALRFYDGAGVLVPAEVDAANGYRRYSDEQVRAARLIAGLRRVGMPVAEIAQAVRELDNPAALRTRLEAHQRRLEAGLADAKRELLRIHTLLDLEDHVMTRITLPAAALGASLDAVRFAANDLTGQLAGVLVETDDDRLILLATDRFRMATAVTAASVVEGPPVRQVLPLSFVDEVKLLRRGELTLEIGDDTVRAEVAGQVVEGKLLDTSFPDLRRLMERPEPATRVTVDVESLRDLVTASPALTREHDGTAYEVSVLAFDQQGSVRVAAESEWAADQDAHVAVNREFLLQALDAGGAGQLVLELDGPIKPLAVRVPGDESHFSILMPVRH